MEEDKKVEVMLDEFDREIEACRDEIDQILKINKSEVNDEKLSSKLLDAMVNLAASKKYLSKEYDIK